MEKQYSKAPWVFEHPWYYCSGNTIAAADGSPIMCKRRAQGETWANAFLVAAAPDLLEALELITAGSDQDTFVLNNTPEIRDKVREAIAKAYKTARPPRPGERLDGQPEDAS